jgi:hypothetical protein
MAAITKKPAQGVGLPPTHQPVLPPITGSEGAIKAYLMPDNVTGVVSANPWKETALKAY